MKKGRARGLRRGWESPGKVTGGKISLTSRTCQTPDGGTHGFHMPALRGGGKRTRERFILLLKVFHLLDA